MVFRRMDYAIVNFFTKRESLMALQVRALCLVCVPICILCMCVHGIVYGVFAYVCVHVICMYIDTCAYR